MQRLRFALALLLPCGTILYSGDAFRKVGLLFYPEQFFAAMLGIALTLVYLHPRLA